MKILNIFTSEQAIIGLDSTGDAWILVQNNKDDPDKTIFEWYPIKEKKENEKLH